MLSGQGSTLSLFEGGIVADGCAGRLAEESEASLGGCQLGVEQHGLPQLAHLILFIKSCTKSTHSHIEQASIWESGYIFGFAPKDER